MISIADLCVSTRDKREAMDRDSGWLFRGFRLDVFGVVRVGLMLIRGGMIVDCVP